MANGEDDSHVSLLCPICIETYVSPRLLKACGHSFCEQCLFMYVSTLKDKGELGSTFPCPVCRHEVTAPTGNDLTMSWIIQEFAVNEYFVKRLTDSTEENMKGEFDCLCDPCSSEDKRIKAVKLCVNCQEYLCVGCVEAHRKYKVLKSHKLADINNPRIFDQIKDWGIQTACERHGDREVELYCKNHDVFCCFICATVSHRNCAELTELLEMETGSKHLMANILEKIALAETQLKQLLTLRQGNVDTLTVGFDDIMKQLKAKRDEFVSSLDGMITEFKNDANHTFEDTKKGIRTAIGRLRAVQSYCDKNKAIIQTLFQSSLPVHKVVVQHRMEDEYKNIEGEIIKEEENMKFLAIQWNGIPMFEHVNIDLKRIFQSRIEIETKPCKLTHFKDVLSSILKNRTIVQTDQRTVCSQISCNPTYTCVSTYDWNYILLCNNCSINSECGCLCLLSCVTGTVSRLNMDEPFSAAVLKRQSSRIAVSVPKDKNIHIASRVRNKMEIIHTFKTAKTPYSLISLANGDVGITWDFPPSFDIVDFTDSEIKTVKSFTQDSTGRTFKSFKYVAVDEIRSNVIQPCEIDHMVYCFNFSGAPVFEYKDPELNYPQGVDIDRDGNVYVCSSRTNQIHVLTPVGLKVKVVKSDVQATPQSLTFDETWEGFWLTNNSSSESNKVHFFRLR